MILGGIYTCEVKVIDSTSDLVIVGEHNDGKGNSDLEGLNIWNQNLEKIPQGVDNFFTNVKALQVYSSKLQTITSENLEQFPKLEVISIRKNGIISLDGNLFENTPNLRFIDFSENLIQHIGRDLLKNLNNLSDVRFIANPCINEVAGREEILYMNENMPLLCPAAKTTTILVPTTTEASTECPASCVEQFEVLENKFSDVVAAYEARIVELEKQMRELNSRP